MEILSFFAGIIFYYTHAVYPLLLIVIALYLRASPVIIIWFLLGVLWAWGHQFFVLERGIPSDAALTHALLQGKIISLPTTRPGKTQFQFALTHLNNKPVYAQVLLSCYQHCPSFQMGEVWQLQAKLKRPVNLANPGHFDFVSWLHTRHLSWTGYIRLKPNYPKRLSRGTEYTSLLLWRQQFANSLAALLDKGTCLGVLQALTLGITTNLDKTDWDLFRRTGTTHLMVISGAHIGLVASFVYKLTRWLWLRLGRCALYYPAARVASLSAILAALSYALLSGFAVPAQRAVMGCCVLLSRHFLRRRFTVWQAWRYALLIVILFEPHAVLLPGFYLSFIAVAILISVHQRYLYHGLKGVLTLQLACLIGLIPLTLYWFSYGALNGFFANLLAIPWVSVIVVPLALVSFFITLFFPYEEVLILIKWVIEALLHYLHWIDHFSWLNLQFSFQQILFPLAIMLALSLRLVLPIPVLLPAVAILAVASFFPTYPKVPAGDVWIDVLDVGQGLAIVVNTAKHTLIYDTGVKFYQGSDMAQQAIIPYLKTLGIKRLDKVIISHPDLDHRGGLASLKAQYAIAELIVDSPKFYRRGKSCHDYPAWSWDDIHFRFFPIIKTFQGKNNRSCVLQIINQAGAVLLTGDLEKAGEEYLLATYGPQLAANYLIIPHHGSKTSSSPAFIHQVAPQYGIISAGLDNRYHFPHQPTLHTLQKNNIKIYNTATCGMTSIRLAKQAKPSAPSCYNKNPTGPRS